MRIRFSDVLKTYGATLFTVRFSLLTIAAMLALGYTTRYAGLDATMGCVRPIGKRCIRSWHAARLVRSGADGLGYVVEYFVWQFAAHYRAALGLSPVLMAAANSSGGVMGKMIDAQSIVVASTATNWFGHEGEILRYVFFHSLALGCLVGILVTLQAYVPPLTHMLP